MTREQYTQGLNSGLMHEMKLSLEEIWEILEQDWLYDLLPGNGQDDYILEQLRWHFMAKAIEAKP